MTEFADERAQKCKRYLEDFNDEQCGKVCTTCAALGVSCLGGSHPHREVSKKTKKMHMYERILFHQYNGDSSDLAAFITGPVPFKIAVTDVEYVEKYPEVFEHGTAEYLYAVDTFMAHQIIGETEVTAVVQDTNWICILERILNSGNNGVAIVLLNKHDKSSTARKRPDTVMMFRQAHILKNEAKATLLKMAEADTNRDLSSKYAALAYLTFPKNRNVIGILSCPGCIQLKEITYDQSSQQYNERTLASFVLDTEERLVSCVQAIFNVARYVLSVAGPLTEFHLVPNMPMETDNGHRVIWEREGLRKILAAGHRNENLLEYLYAANLVNVEWGVVEGPDKILITRIGHKLRTALLHGRITAEKAIADIQAGVAQMHERNIAHTDLKVDNVFVDVGVAFLDDLEYITEIDTIMNKPYRVLSPIGQPNTMTAKELDLKQLEELVREIRSFQPPVHI